MKRSACVAVVLAQALSHAQARADDAVQEVTVRAAKPKRETVTITIPAEQASKVPGTQGDAVKVVESLPGVARPSFGTSQLVVWGSAPAETRVYVDGVEIPALYHGSGIRGTINGGLVRSIEIVPGAYGVEYGRGLGGIVRVETKELPDEGVHGYAAADTLDASAMTSAAIDERFRVGVAARYGYLDRVLSLVSAKDIGDYYAIPRYRDYQAKAQYALSDGETLSIAMLGSGDDLSRTIASADPGGARTERTSSTFHRVYARYVRRGEEGDRGEVTPFVGYDTSSVATAFGGTPTHLSVDSVRYGVRASSRSAIGDHVTLALGADVMGTASTLSRAGSLTLPPREGDIVAFGQPPSGRVNADDWTAHVLDAGPYVAADLRFGALTVTPGIRFDAFLVEASQKAPRVGSTPPIGRSQLFTTYDPRVAIGYRVSPRFALTAAAGKYHQPPDAQDLSAVFGTPALTPSSGSHYTLGQSIRVTKTLTAETTLFYKTATDLPVRSRLAQPKLALALVQDGEARTFGGQVLVRQQLWKGFFGWIAYTISKSDRKYLYDPSWRPFDYDQPHVLAIVASQAIGRFTFGARFRYASGMPRTPVIGATYDASADRYDPIFGAQNSIRLPPFYELDLRAERTFDLGRGVVLSAYVDALNVTFHKNAEEIAYSSDYTTRAYITGLPTIAVVGARVDF